MQFSPCNNETRVHVSVMRFLDKTCAISAGVVVTRYDIMSLYQRNSRNRNDLVIRCVFLFCFLMEILD